MRMIDADALMKDICDSLNQMTNIGIAVDGDWLWAKLNDAIDNAPTIESEQQWIPCSENERLPEVEELVLVTDDSGGIKTVDVDRCGQYENSNERFWYHTQNAVAWMPLPEPYKEGAGMNDFEKLINASDLIEWIMETYPDWCEGAVRSIVDHIEELPPSQQKPLKYTGESICVYCRTTNCKGCMYEPMTTEVQQ